MTQTKEDILYILRTVRILVSFQYIMLWFDTTQGYLGEFFKMGPVDFMTRKIKFFLHILDSCAADGECA